MFLFISLTKGASGVMDMAFFEIINIQENSNIYSISKYFLSDTPKSEKLWERDL